MPFRYSPLSVVLVLGLGLWGCGSSSDKRPPDQRSNEPAKMTQVEVFSWWVQPGTREAFQALVDLNDTSYPTERIFNAAQAATDAGNNAKMVLAQRFDDGDPPDLFQQNAYEMRSFLAGHPGSVEPLDDLFDELRLKDTVVPEILDAITIDGHIYSMPVNAHRENSLFYNKQLFAEAGLDAPTTQAEFLSACEELKAKGITPVALSTSQGWIITKLFYDLALGSMGGQAFADYFSGKAPMDKEALGKAIEVLDLVLTSYINEDANTEGYSWAQAADKVFKGEAAMFLHGDWVKGYLVQLGWTPDVDFGVVPSPGATDTFVFGTDVFGLPAGAQHREGARDFLTTVASLDGQVAFNTFKGSSPMRLDTPNVEFDGMGQEVMADLADAKIRVALVGKGAWDTAMAAFAKDHDKDALMQAFVDNPPGM